MTNVLPISQADNATILPQVFAGVNADAQAKQEAADALATGYLTVYTGARAAVDCKNAGSLPQSTTLKVTTNPILNSAVNSIPVVGQFIEAGLQFFNKVFGIFTHGHAVAVQKEQGTLCSAVPQANQNLAAIDQAWYAGQLTPDEAIAAAQGVESDFRSAVAPITKTCNAACEVSDMLHGLVLQRQLLYPHVSRLAMIKKYAPYAIGGAVLLIFAMSFRRK